MLKVTKSNRSELLVAPLAEALKACGGNPFQEPIVVVGADGVRHWLAKRVAQELGVCARVRFVYPGTLVHEVIQACVGAPNPDRDPWRAEALQWAVLAALPPLLGGPAFEPLRGYLTPSGSEQPEVGGIKAFQLARRIARTFSRYLTFRPDMLLRWDAGSSAGASKQPWQPELWRALASRLPAHPAKRQREFMALARRRGGLPAGLAPVHLFGISSLPDAQVQVLAALSRHADVHLYAVSPSGEDWRRVRAHRDAWRHAERRDDGGLDPDLLEGETGHPLLASLGTLGREFQVLLEREADYDEADSDCFEEPRQPTLLGRLQRDVFRLSVPEAESRHVVADGDTSLTVHACHGDMRQVEVLQDQLLDLFSHDPTLQPSDVIVLTPDVETFAPLVEAVFRSAQGRLPVRVANRAQRTQNPLAEAVLRILSLVGQRLTVTRVVDVLGLEPVRRRFELSSDDVNQAAEWVRSAQVRWGIDADDRVSKGQPAYDLNTWEWGIDRLVLGYAMPGEGRDLFAERLPFDEVEGSDARVLGGAIEFFQTLFRQLRGLETPARSPREWAQALREAVSELTQVDEAQAHQIEEVQAAIDALESEALGFEEPVAFDVPRAILEDGFDQSRAATAFLTGSVTVCGMVPLRSIGHRVVCLLGMDDGAFPRSVAGGGFDLLRGRPALGDRSPRDDDRYLFLEALLAARDHVRVFYSGQSVRDNKPLPPSVVVSELLDGIAQSFRLAEVEGESDEAARRRLIERLVLRHPLQPFSPRYFGADGDERLFSYATRYVEGARALVSVPDAPRSFWDDTLPEPHVEPGHTLALWELEAFFGSPVASLLRGRLGLSYPSDAEQTDDREPLALGGLAGYGVGAGLLERSLGGASLRKARAATLASGQLPLGTPGACAVADVGDRVQALADAITRLRGAPAPEEAVELDLILEGTRLVGHVPSIWSGGQVVHHYARARAGYSLRVWIRHLALCAAGHGQRSVLVTGAKTDPFFEAEAYEPLEPGEARAHLESLLAIYAAGQVRPLLFFPKSSLAYAQAFEKVTLKKGPGQARFEGEKAARREWIGNRFGGTGGDRDDPFVARVFGEDEPFALGYAAPGLEIGEGFAFHDLALRVFGPLLEQRVGIQ